MKGPGLRLEHDVRRRWTCPKCGHSFRESVHIVARQCRAENCGEWMTMEEPSAPQRNYEPHVVAEAGIEDFGVPDVAESEPDSTETEGEK